jgi:hypothetical protein
VRHRLGDEAETGIQDLACDHACMRVVTACRGRDYRVRQRPGSYHAPPLSRNRRRTEKPCWTSKVQL